MRLSRESVLAPPVNLYKDSSQSRFWAPDKPKSHDDRVSYQSH